VAAYRFCRTDDIGLLVNALNRCGHDPPMTPEAFKRSIRDLQVWCSSCMVAFAGSDPIGVLIGAKRRDATLIHRIAVHPDHRRQGHGRHLLESMGSKLSILGPPRIVAEVPDTLDAAWGLFEATGYVQETLLTDYVLERDDPAPVSTGTAPCHERAPQGASRMAQGASRMVIPITVDDLAANGLPVDAQGCWERSMETLVARKDDLSGLAVASDERIEACILYICREPGREADLVWLRSFVEDGDARLTGLLGHVQAQGTRTLRFGKAHPEEAKYLENLGFRPAEQYRLYATRARSL
jgi:GNAT superfamily N-acetyltransferase